LTAARDSGDGLTKFALKFVIDIA